MDPLKATLAAGFGAAVIGGGWGLSDYLISVRYTTIKESGTDAYSAETIGGRYKDQFVDPLLASNEKWWNWVYENVFKVDKAGSKITISSEFSKIEKGFVKDIPTNATQHLNQVCHTALLKKEVEVINSDYVKNIWRYCSSDSALFSEKGNEPTAKTLSDETTTSNTYENKFGGITNNKSKLVADIEGNKGWWDWVYENVFKPFKEKSSDQLNSHFGSVEKGYGNTNDDATKALNKVCETAYKKDKTDFSNETTTGNEDKNKLKKNVEMFCVKGKDKSLSIA
ncbi:hypothetical protein [Candidatus Mycoplasma haematohominis]|uniref:hypothetical protein n=1 Tax=Candidatus Mycoplasma haematohominis TaxID=1494318 RepID=UPI001C0A67B8|nr:hypothetical protein [Candidatus Mycoplasma haemohominis]